MFYIWAEIAHSPNGIVDAGSTLFSSDATDDDFAEYAKSRGFTEFDPGPGWLPTYYNREAHTSLALISKHADSDVANYVAACIKIAGHASGR